MRRLVRVIDAAPTQVAAIEAVLARFGDGPRAVAERAGTRIVALATGQRFDDRSRVLRRLGAGVDGWPLPPAGVFVVEERTIYLRSTSPMTVAHEFGHERVIFSSAVSLLFRPRPTPPLSREILA